MDAMSEAMWRRRTRRRSDDVSVVELQEVMEAWLEKCNGWGRIDSAIATLKQRVTTKTAADVPISKNA